MRLPKVQYLIAAAVLAALGFIAERIDWNWSLASTAASLRYDLEQIDPIDGFWRMYLGQPETNCLPPVALGDTELERQRSEQRREICRNYCSNLSRCRSAEEFNQIGDCFTCIVDCQTQPPQSTMVPWCKGKPSFVGSIFGMAQNFFSFLLPSLSWTGTVVWLGSLFTAAAAVTGLFMRRAYGSWGERGIERSPLSFIFWIIIGTPILAVGIVFVLKWLLIGLVSLLGATAGLIVWAFAAFKIGSTLFGIYTTARDLESYAEGSK